LIVSPGLAIHRQPARGIQVPGNPVVSVADGDSHGTLFGCVAAASRFC